ncbi:acyltransferase family protein [Sphingomonas immobilis]|uniref:Acyltransferase n=1 Tax=Sphingomonas immobilis TaxID=3063997 RepID=A0ABT9A1M9_9SPHN|nr:acyltransferase [Sphingomonas sp. CA1-15]MDO7843289.1 acyltransferase [Sphingomonas sp. CA1-15]
MTGGQGNRRQTLDVVRGIAILLVIAFHLDAATGVAAIDALRPVARAGWCGVDLFFVLSGFLVGGMVLEEAARPEGLRLGRFFSRRALRLLPPLYAYLAALLLIGGAQAWPMVMPVLFHLQNYGTTAPSHLWSLAVEEHFYLAAAFALPWLARRGGTRVIAALMAVMIACLALRTGALIAGETHLHLQWQTQYRIDALTMGVLLAAVRLYRPALFAALTERRWLFGGVAAAGFAVLVTIGDDGWRPGLGFVIAYPAAAALILALYSARIPRLLEWPACGLARLGVIAYSLYIWHASVARVVEGLAPAIGSPLLVLALKYAAVIAVAAAMYAAVERPALRLRTVKWAFPRRAPKALAA